MWPGETLTVTLESCTASSGCTPWGQAPAPAPWPPALPVRLPPVLTSGRSAAGGCLPLGSCAAARAASQRLHHRPWSPAHRHHLRPPPRPHPGPPPRPHHPRHRYRPCLRRQISKASSSCQAQRNILHTPRPQESTATTNLNGPGAEFPIRLPLPCAPSVLARCLALRAA